MNQNKSDCIKELNYLRKALMKRPLYQYDAILYLIDTLTEYSEKEGEDEDDGSN